MIVYHASYTVVTNVDLKYSRKYTDFSTGFYLTKNKAQAKKWAEKIISMNKTAYINQYLLDENKLSKYKVLKFNNYDKNWLDFICKCRNGDDDSDFDVVVGPIADDKVYETINLFFEGFIDEKEAIKRLKKNEPNNQICLRNMIVINDLLEFEKGEKYNG